MQAGALPASVSAAASAQQMLQKPWQMPTCPNAESEQQQEPPVLSNSEGGLARRCLLGKAGFLFRLGLFLTGTWCRGSCKESAIFVWGKGMSKAMESPEVL